MKVHNKYSTLKVSVDSVRNHCFRKIKRSTALDHTNKSRHNNSEAIG